MRVYFGGAEIAAYQKRIAAHDKPNRAISFARVFQRPAVTYVRDGARYWLDHGLATSRKAIQDVALADYLKAYLTFALTHIDQIDGVNEFDWLPTQDRDAAWEVMSEMVGDKAQRIWRVSDGPKALAQIAAERQSFTVVGNHAISRDVGVVARLSKLSNTGHKIHVHVAPNIGDLLRINPSSVSTMTWASPLRFGDLVIPAGPHRVSTYNPPHSAETVHKAVQGAREFDIDQQLVQSLDPNTLASLAILTLGRFEMIEETPEDPVVLGNESSADTENMVSEETNPPEVDKGVRHETTRLPVFNALDRVSEIDGKSTTTLSTNGESMRLCDTCALANACPAYQAESACSFNMPVSLRTPEQYAALVDSLCEMQTARVAFGRFAEEINGDSLDPDVGRELDRLMRMLKTKGDLETRTESLSISVQGSSSGGILSSLFGRNAPPTALAPQENAQPVRPDTVLGELATRHEKTTPEG